MLGTALCVLAFVACAVAGRRSLLGGLYAVLTIGYAYGYVRAIVPSSASHFIFDCAVLGLYAARLFRAPHPGEPRESHGLRLWVLALCAWPVLLLAVPTQEPAIQLVGLRAAAFLVPFMLFGARLDGDELYRLALWCAVLNIAAFGFAAAEFTFGLERFLPHNAVTELVYQQHDVVGASSSASAAAATAPGVTRIPSTFPTASAYAGAMVITLPLLLGAWARRRRTGWDRLLLLASIVATGVGVFLAASRTHAVVLFLLVLVAVFSGRVRVIHRIGALLAIAVVAVLVSREARLQRFTTLQDTGYLAERVSWSVNGSVVDILAERPFGNGLGGGGTNIPYFLRSQVKNSVAIENEYAKIALEQGFPGLALWLAFVVWAFARRASRAGESWHLGRRLAWVACGVYFGTAWIGLGLLTSVPSSALLLFLTGWIAGRPRSDASPRVVRIAARRPTEPTLNAGAA